MTEKERMALREIISARQQIALDGLDENPRYLEVRERQRQTEERVEDLYKQKFERDDRLFIRRHYEDEAQKSDFEFDEIYIQGLRDSVKLMAFLGVFNFEVDL